MKDRCLIDIIDDFNSWLLVVILNWLFWFSEWFTFGEGFEAAVANILDVYIDDVIESFPEFPSHF